MGEDQNRYLHWFGLTAGRYWISTPSGDALRYTDAQVSLWGLPSHYVDYQVGQFFFDLLDLLPRALESMPDDFAAVAADARLIARMESWQSGFEVEHELWELVFEALGWYEERRCIDTYYLTNGPLIFIWRFGESVSLRWRPTGENPDGVWSTPYGEVTLSVDEFTTAAYGFLEKVVAAMQARVDAIQSNGWVRTDCWIDVPLLVSEQQKYAASLKNSREQRHETDWDSYRPLMARLAAEFSKGERRPN